MNTENLIFNTKQASDYLQISIGTLAVCRCNKTYPIPYYKCGGRIRYLKSDLDAWLNTRTFNKEGGRHE